MRLRLTGPLLFTLLAFATSHLTACSERDDDQASGGGSGGTAGTAVGGTGGNTFNQCGVAAPLPADTGQCTVVNAPLITDFDDYAGTAASSYTFYVNAEPPATDAVLGGILHVDDGSAASGAVVTTEMVTGEGDAGYALEIANTNAATWGGLLMFYFPSSAAPGACLNALNHGGVAFSIKGRSPSGRFGVSLNMLDTIPAGENGLCDNPTTSDCKNATIELTMPVDAESWTQVEVPWSAFTPGIGSATSCVPVTGQNVVRLVIQPFMNYPPPDYMFEAGAYAMAVDNVRFY